MQILRDLTALPDAVRGGAVTIGNFDGVHRGHVKIMNRLLERAAEVKGPAVVFTFDPHPVRILRPDKCPPPLTWTERKAELLASHGVDWIVAYPTDESLLSLSASEFFEKVVCDSLNAKALVEGPNFYFGHNREGDISRLQKLVVQTELSLDVVKPVIANGKLVSSSQIRQLLTAGEVGLAGEMLSAPYRIRGMVMHGAGRGAQLGFPTANLAAIDTLLPAQGVYAGQGWVGNDTWPAAINLGSNPTFGDASVKVEVHLIGCEESLYGQPLEVDFFARLREIHPFDTAAALKAQLAKDVQKVRQIAATFP